jgi:hypothetical protein
MRKSEMNRRRFLESSGQAAAGAAVVVATAGPIATAPRAALAATSVISADQAATLVAMARQIFPHHQLGDEYYAAAVEALDEKAAADPKLAAQVTAGVAKLDSTMELPFLQLSRGNQLKVLQQIADTPFFTTVRGTTLGALYTNPNVMRDFGYEGSSVEYGGYLHRGFDDIGWLPELPEKAL